MKLRGKILALAATMLLTASTQAVYAKTFKMAIGDAQGGTQYALGEKFASYNFV